MFGIDDLDLGSLSDLFGVGDAAGAATGLVDAGAFDAPAGLDVANAAFTGAAPAAEAGSNVLSAGQNAAAVGGQAPGVSAPYPDQPSEFYSQPGREPNPNALVDTPGVGKSGTSGMNSYEQPSMQTPNDAAGSMGGPTGGLPPSPTQSFREAVGAIPGKWYNAISNAPADLANYAGNNPFKTGALLAGAGATAYSAANQPSAPTYNFAPAPSSSGPRPAAPELPPNGPPQSPITAGRGIGVRGRGGFNVGM